MRSVPIWLLRFCSKFFLIFIECIRRNLQIPDALFIIQTSVKCPTVLEDEFFSGNRFLRCELCTLLLTYLLSVQFSRLYALFCALVKVIYFFLRLFKGKFDLLCCQSQQISIDALKDKVCIISS